MPSFKCLLSEADKKINKEDKKRQKRGQQIQTDFVKQSNTADTRNDELEKNDTGWKQTVNTRKGVSCGTRYIVTKNLK